MAMSVTWRNICYGRSSIPKFSNSANSDSGKPSLFAKTSVVNALPWHPSLQTRGVGTIHLHCSELLLSGSEISLGELCLRCCMISPGTLARFFLQNGFVLPIINIFFLLPVTCQPACVQKMYVLSNRIFIAAGICLRTKNRERRF
jgi:hypothetical protein